MHILVQALLWNREGPSIISSPHKHTMPQLHMAAHHWARLWVRTGDLADGDRLLRAEATGARLQVYGEDFFTGIASCLPDRSAPPNATAATSLAAQDVQFKLGDSLAADVVT